MAQKITTELPEDLREENTSPPAPPPTPPVDVSSFMRSIQIRPLPEGISAKQYVPTSHTQLEREKNLRVFACTPICESKKDPMPVFTGGTVAGLDLTEPTCPSGPVRNAIFESGMITGPDELISEIMNCETHPIVLLSPEKLHEQDCNISAYERQTRAADVPYSLFDVGATGLRCSMAHLVAKGGATSAQARVLGFTVNVDNSILEQIISLPHPQRPRAWELLNQLNIASKWAQKGQQRFNWARTSLYDLDIASIVFRPTQSPGIEDGPPRLVPGIEVQRHNLKAAWDVGVLFDGRQILLEDVAGGYATTLGVLLTISRVPGYPSLLDQGLCSTQSSNGAFFGEITITTKRGWAAVMRLHKIDIGGSEPLRAALRLRRTKWAVGEYLIPSWACDPSFHEGRLPEWMAPPPGPKV